MNTQTITNILRTLNETVETANNTPDLHALQTKVEAAAKMTVTVVPQDDYTVCWKLNTEWWIMASVMEYGDKVLWSASDGDGVYY